jgi:WD40 repeat protein
VFDTTSWELLQVIEASDHGGVIAAGFSDDGMTLVTLGIDGTIALRDAQTWAFVREIAGGVSATDNLDPGVYLSADGVFLLTTRDTQPRLWHLPSGTVIGAFPHRAGLVASGVGIGPQLRLVTMEGDHALIWNLEVTSWPDIACRAAGRNFTSAEWAQFGPKGVPYAATCAQWPAAA